MTATVVKTFYDIPGWFRWLDMIAFRTVLEAQVDSPAGVLVELGTYQGKSAVVIGDHVRPGDRFVALDLFGGTELLDDSAASAANRRETEHSYRSLTRRQFEQNYLCLHDELPEVIQAESSRILDHVEPGTVRFLHVDASHLYDQVHLDASNAKTLLRPGGLVVFDDYRSLHTPGVSAAVWQAVIEDGLIPVALTPAKLYGVYDDPEPYLTALHDRFERDEQSKVKVEDILGRRVLRAEPVARSKPPTAPVPPPPTIDVDKLARQVADRVAPLVIARLPKPPPRPEQKPAPPPPATVGGRVRRNVARNLAPPALTRWVRNRRRGHAVSAG